MADLPVLTEPEEDSLLVSVAPDEARALVELLELGPVDAVLHRVADDPCR